MPIESSIDGQKGLENSLSLTSEHVPGVIIHVFRGLVIISSNTFCCKRPEHRALDDRIG